MPRPANTDERRAQITRAFQSILARQGYDGAAIADVARAADLSPGLLHYHFKSKLEILLAVLDGLVERHDRGLSRRLARSAGDPVAELGAFIDFHLGLGSEADPEALACWIVLSGEALRTPRVQKAFARALASMVERLTAILDRGVASGVFRGADPALAAPALVASIEGYFVLAATAPGIIPAGSAATSLKRMAHGLLQPDRPFGPAPKRR